MKIDVRNLDLDDWNWAWQHDEQKPEWQLKPTKDGGNDSNVSHN